MQTSQAQQYFNIRDAMHSVGTILTSVVQHNGKYYVTGLCTDSMNYIGNNTFTNVEGIRFGVYDSTGLKIRDTFYQKVYLQAMEPWNSSSLYVTSDGNFLLASQFMDTTTWNALALKFDSLGHLLSEKRFNQPLCNNHEWYKVTDFKPTPFGEWLLLGDITCDINATQTQNAMALTKLDSNFNVIWSKQYGSAPNNHIPNKILVESDGYILSGGVNDQNTVANGSYFQPELIRTDTSGVEQWTWIRSLGGYYNVIKDVIRTKDGGYIYCGQGDGYPYATYMEWKGWVEKLDANRAVVWNHEISASYSSTDYNELNVVKELQDSSVVIAGGLTGGYTPPDSSNDIMFGALMRFKGDGTVMWQRKYRVFADFLEYYFYDMKPTSDGGFIMVGQANDLLNHYGLPNQRGWLVKVDSNGCVSPTACDATDVPNVVANGNGIKVYPNPVSDVLQVDYWNITSGEISILDVTGRVMLSQELEHTISLRQLVSGIYVYKITDKGIVRAQGKIVKE
jgi:hypothetical protein